MNSKILTTHVGSLPRPAKLSQLLFAKDKNEIIDEKEFDDVVREEVKNIVQRQVNCGIDVVSDGEMSKISYSTYIKDRLHGFSGESERKAPADLEAFPSYKEKIAKSGGTPTYTRPCCTEELSIKDAGAVKKDIDNFTAALQHSNVKSGFMNAASPGVIALFLSNKFYETQDKYLEALALLMAKEYKTIADAGLLVQLDCPDLALARHMIYNHLSDKEFLVQAEKQIEYLNFALKDIKPEQIRMHICWGNYEGPHTHDIGLDKILPIIYKANVKYISLESSNPRHAHEWKVFGYLKLPKDKIIIPGVIDSTTNFVEHPEVVADRLIQFSTVIDKEQLMAGTDCGFSTFAGFGKIDEEICFYKLKALVEGASIASKII